MFILQLLGLDLFHFFSEIIFIPSFFFSPRNFFVLFHWQARSFDSHTNNVMAVGFQCDGKWMYSGSEDGTVKIWDMRYKKDHKRNRYPFSPCTLCSLLDFFRYLVSF